MYLSRADARYIETVLAFLRHRQPATIRAIADALGVNPRRVTKRVASLGERGVFHIDTRRPRRVIGVHLWGYHEVNP